MTTGLMQKAAFVSLSVVLALVSLPPISLHAGPPPSESRPAESAGYPVTLGDQVLFRIREKIKSLPPEERARSITARIKQLVQDPRLSADSISVIDSELPTSDVVVGDRVIFTLLDEDARAEGRSRQELAREYALQLRQAIERYRREYNLRSIALACLYTLFSIALLLIGWRVINAFFRWMNAALVAWVEARLSAEHLQTLEIFHAHRVRAALEGALKTLRIILLAVVVYTFLHVVLGLFPWTRPFAARLLDYILVPITTIGEAIVEYFPNLFFIAVVAVLTRYALKLTRLFFSGVEARRITLAGFYPDWAQPTYKLVRVLLIAFAVVMMFPYIPGSGSPAFQGISIFLGVLFSLGSQSAVANIVAGIMMTYRRAFTVGDFVRIGEVMGTVTQVRLQVTHIRTIKNEEILVPNSTILSTHVTNYSVEARGQGLILHTTVTIGYGTLWRQVHDLLVSAALATEHLLKEPAPFVLQSALNDFYVTYELNAYTDTPHLMPRIYSNLHENIQDRFNEAGVEIMSPHYTQIRDGHQVTIPEQFLPKDYVPSAFRVVRTDKIDGGSIGATRAATQ
jgi:small-conductance mechanosensitive channel